MLCRFFCNIRLLWFTGKKSCIIKVKDKELKIHRYWLPGRLLCSIRSNRKWCKRRGSSLECQNCFFVYPIIDSNLINLLILRFYCTLHPLFRVQDMLRNVKDLCGSGAKCCHNCTPPQYSETLGLCAANTLVKPCRKSSIYSIYPNH